MLFVLLLGALSVVLSGCEPVEPQPTPRPQGHATMDGGAYLLRVEAVLDDACRGRGALDAEDLVGQSLDAELLVDGRGAAMDLSGVYLEGGFFGPSLRLAGSVPLGGPVDHPDDDTDEDVVTDADDVTEEEVDEGSDEGRPPRFGRSEVGHEDRPDGDRPDGDRPPRPDEDRPPHDPRGPALSVGLDLQVLDRSRAEGRLVVDDGRCAIQAHVVMVPDRGDRPEEEQPDRGDEEAPADEPEGRDEPSAS